MKKSGSESRAGSGAEEAEDSKAPQEGGKAARGGGLRRRPKPCEPKRASEGEKEGGTFRAAASALAATRAEVSKARSSAVGLFHSFRRCAFGRMERAAVSGKASEKKKNAHLSLPLSPSLRPRLALSPHISSAATPVRLRIYRAKVGLPELVPGGGDPFRGDKRREAREGGVVGERGERGGGRRRKGGRRGRSEGRRRRRTQQRREQRVSSLLSSLFSPLLNSPCRLGSVHRQQGALGEARRREERGRCC